MQLSFYQYGFRFDHQWVINLNYLLHGIHLRLTKFFQLRIAYKIKPNLFLEVPRGARHFQKKITG